MASNESGGSNKKRQVKFICSCPPKHCNGSSAEPGEYKTHPTQDEVKKCLGRYLVSVEGYTKLSKREFISPNNGPVLILSKKAIRSKGGKGDRYMCRPARIRVW